MKRILYGFITLLVITYLSGCGVVGTEQLVSVQETSNTRYLTYVENHPEATFIYATRPNSSDPTLVVYNAESKVLYSVSNSRRGGRGVLTELHDAEGNPLIYKEN